MKTIMKVFNTCSIVVLLILLLTLFTNEGYSDTLGVAPLYFRDILIVPIVLIGPVIIIYIVLTNEVIEFKIPVFLFFLSLGSFYLSYQEYPSIKAEKIFSRMIEYNDENNGFTEIEKENICNNESEYQRHYLQEIEMISSMYKNQYDFITNAIIINDPRIIRSSFFFGLLGFVLLANSIYSFIIIKKKTI